MHLLLFNRTFRRIALAFMRAYLHVSEGATRDGTDTGGYIVRMNTNQYARYVHYARSRTQYELLQQLLEQT